MLWFQGMEEPRYSEYNLEQFKGRGACLDYIFWNKAELVEQLYSVHVEDEQGNDLKTWAFFCEGRKIFLEEVSL